MSLADWQLDLRALGYDGDFDFESLKATVESLGWRFQALVQMPEKRDPDWPSWAASANKWPDRAVTANGADEVQAMGSLLAQILSRPRV